MELGISVLCLLLVGLVLNNQNGWFANWGDLVLDWIRTAHRTSAWTTSVCTGALMLGAAGLLVGTPATTHWRALEDLAAWGAVATRARVVETGKIITAAGVSAGIDMALLLAQRVAGDRVAQAIQLIIEYDSQPPFDAGSPDRASAAVAALARELLQPPGRDGGDRWGDG